MAILEIAKIQVRRGQENITGIPRLDPGEFAWAEDTEQLYIGKRIVEGANSDDNTRILTQNDYDNLFAIASGFGTTAVASTSTYRYRDAVPFNSLHSTTTTVGNKLDINVSLVDFGVIPSTTATDIYTNLNLAVSDLFANLSLGDNTRRKLIIPAGQYYVSGTINLPPYASLAGEGSGLTKLILTNDQVLFRTVDSAGNVWDQGMLSGGAESKNISLEGMTLAYSSGTTFTSPLVSLDNSSDSVLRDIEFTTNNLVTNTAYGTGLRLRGGQRIAGVEQAKNISIEDCLFKDIGLAISSTGTVVNTKIDNGTFYNLSQGINLNSDGAAIAPSNTVITRNKFENIELQAIFVGSSTNRSDLVSENNVFQQVGNGPALNDNTSTICYPVLSFYGEGCSSNNDKFSRRDAAIATTDPLFYYNPLVAGNGTISNNGTYNAIIQSTDPSGYVAVLDKFYGTDQNQKLKIDYTISTVNNNYTRSGTLTITIPTTASIADASISDYYDYSYDDTAYWSGQLYVDSATGDPGHPLFNLVVINFANNYIQMSCQVFGGPTSPTPPGDGDTYILNYKINSVT